MIKIVHTLGPHGTNCEKAAKKWIEKNNYDAEIILHNTLEEAVHHLTADSILLSCIIYPKINDLVFENLYKMELVDCFIEPTFNMVLAQKDVKHSIEKIYSHPAPVSLLNYLEFNIDKVTFVNSNAEAARLCVELNEACITTKKAADFYKLTVYKDFGEVPMGFAIHALKNK